jgi:hypothetical protein
MPYLEINDLEGFAKDFADIVREKLGPLRAEIVALKAENAEMCGRLNRLEALADKSVTRLPIKGAA